MQKKIWHSEEQQEDDNLLAVSQEVLPL